MSQGSEAYEETKSTVRNAYDKTSQAVQSGYNRTIEYSKEHPRRFSLLTFAAGIGAGTLIAARYASSHTRTERIASPLIDAVAEVARAVIRR